MRIESLDQRRALWGDAHDNVAGQQQSDLLVDIQCSMGELGVAGTEDEVGLHVVSELVVQRCVDVDLGEHTKALSLQGEVVPGLVDFQAAVPRLAPAVR